jgi:hypothetical protein
MAYKLTIGTIKIFTDLIIGIGQDVTHEIYLQNQYKKNLRLEMQNFEKIKLVISNL